nr:hypothetical protein [Tanacetum cinerariifolium]
MKSVKKSNVNKSQPSQSQNQRRSQGRRIVKRANPNPSNGLECPSCGALYTKSCGCSKGGFVDKVVCNKTPDSSQQPPPDCLKCGNPVDGLYCRHCALLRKKLKKVWFTICGEHEFFQDFLNTSESSNDNTNIVSAPQEPIVFNQDPGKNSSQSPPHIDHHCCYGCGDPLDGIFCRRCICESCGNGAHIGYNCSPKVPIISTPEPCHNQNVDEFPQTLTNFHPTCYYGDENSDYDSTPNFVNDCPNVFNPPSQPPTYSYEFCGNDAHYSHDQLFRKLFNDVQNIHEELAEYINTPSWNRHAFSNYDYDDDEDYTIAITLEEPNNSLSMGDEHLDTIPTTELDEVIKSSVEDLVLIPSEFEGISNNTCDVPFRDNSSPLNISKDQFEEFSDSNDDSTSIDDDYFSIENIEYIEASPPDFELVSLEEVKDDNLREKLLNINLLIAKIEYLNDNPTPDCVLKSSSPFSIPIKPDQGELTSVVRKDNLGEPRVHVPNVLPIHPTPMMDSDFISFDNSLPEFEIFYFDIEEKNSGSTTIHVDISLPDLECFNFKSEPDPGELTSIVDSEIRENVLSATNVNLPPEEDHYPLIAYVVWIFLSFLTYLVVPPYLLSSGNEDSIFDPASPIIISLL